MATVLVYGSHPQILGYVAAQLHAAGYDVVPSLDRETTIAAIEERHVDVLVLGGPSAHEHREEVVTALLTRQPWAGLVFPGHPDDVLERVAEHFTTYMS